MSSDDSAVFIDSESPSLFPTSDEPDLNELYKHIPPPIPLVPKNKYKEEPRSFELWQSERQSALMSSFEERKKSPLCSITPFTQSTLDPNNNLIAFVEGGNFVFKREPNEKSLFSLSKKLRLDNINALPKLDYKKNIENPIDHLTFESRFESGNLALALKISENEYNLLMQNDINTKGHTQWFYFRVQILEKKCIKFNILNFTKKDSLFNYGMKVLMYSNKKYKDMNIGWFRDGVDINYYPNNIVRTAKGDSFYTLTFTYDFPYDNDCVLFAYCFPYTYSEMIKDLDFWEITHPEIVERRALCLTVAEKKCEVVTITAPGTSEDVKKRKGAVITARVHPGETVGSWMMKGVIEFLISNSIEARALREKYVFKIVPMMNPDGVIFGNYRCGLAGCDLNRNWKSPSKVLHPTVYAVKKLVKAFSKERVVDFICDLHGHSKKKNIFMYGCNIPEEPELTRSIPFIISKFSPYFHYPSCSFKMQKSKEATMRISLFKETKIPLVYTLEASFFGGDYGEFKDKHYTTADLKEMGKQVALALLIFNNVDVPNKPIQVLSDETIEPQVLSKRKILQELQANKTLLTESSQDSSGSDSDPSDDNLESKDLESITKVSSIKILEFRKKQLKELNQKARPLSNYRDLPNKALSVPRKVKCNLCGEILALGHACNVKPRKLSNNGQFTKSATIAYINAHGKKVRDQGTQTVKVEESKTVSPHGNARNHRSHLTKALQYSVRNNISEDVASLGRLWRKKHLPNLKKISIVKYSN